MDISQMPGSCYTAARKGGDRFCVGSGPRYALGQADYAANKAKEYQFESLHKIYFYDAWRWKIELNLPDSPLRLPPRPGLLQNGCYWHQPVLRPTDDIHSYNTQENAAPAGSSLKQGVAPSLHGQDNTTVESPGQGTQRRKQRRRWRTCMCRRWGKDASLSSKASCSERRTLTLQDALATNMK